MTGRQALVVADVQQGLVDALGADELVHTIDNVVAGARAAGVPVVFVATRFRLGGGDVSARNSALRAAAESGTFTEGTPNAAFHEGMNVLSEDVVVVKRRVSAFVGTDLEHVLRALDIDTVIVTGLTTAGVVLSTVRHACDLDFRTVVLRDACADPNPDVHDLLVEHVLSAQSSIADTGQWLASVKS